MFSAAFYGNIHKVTHDSRHQQNTTATTMQSTAWKSPQHEISEDVCESMKRMANAFEEQNKQNAELIKQNAQLIRINGQALEEAKKRNQILEGQLSALQDQSKIPQRAPESCIIQQNKHVREYKDDGKARNLYFNSCDVQVHHH